MSLIKCPECGQEVSDHATACIHCGFPLIVDDDEELDGNESDNNIVSQSISNVQNKREISKFRLVLGILSLIFSVGIIYQSYYVHIANALLDNKSRSSSIGYLVAACFLLAGILSIVYNGAVKSNNGLITIIYAFGGIIGFTSESGIYKDLHIWSIVCIVYAFIFAGYWITSSSKKLS